MPCTQDSWVYDVRGRSIRGELEIFMHVLFNLKRMPIVWDWVSPFEIALEIK